MTPGASGCRGVAPKGLGIQARTHAHRMCPPLRGCGIAQGMGGGGCDVEREKHTPAPWKFRRYGSEDMGCIEGIEYQVCSFGVDGSMDLRDSGPHMSHGDAPSDADLALILAAPVLLAAVEKAVAEGECTGPSDTHHCHLIMEDMEKWCAHCRLDHALETAKDQEALNE